MTRLLFTASSRAEDAGFVALADLAHIAAGLSYRVIGGHMVQLLAAMHERKDLFRLTGDADLGVPPAAVSSPELIEALKQRDYEQLRGNRFRRLVHLDESQHGTLGAEAYAVVDILVPTYDSRVRSNRAFGDHLTTTEVPGLAFALRREPIIVDLDLRRLSGESHEVELQIPDQVAALVLKAMATTVREKSTDFSDLWRCLEICAAAGVSLSDVEPHSDIDAAVQRITSIFEDRHGPGMQMIEDDLGLSELAADQHFTRLRALVDRVAGS